MITDEEFQRISVYMKANYGIDLSQKKVIINGRLENYLRKGGYGSCTEYLNALGTDKTGTLEKMLVNLLTTNHTYFMREFEHFEFMKQKLLPKLKASEAASKDLRIWSAASSTGEEAYTIAMVLKDFFGIDHHMWDTTVLATDISTKVLMHAQRGRYLKEQIEPLPENWRRKYFKQISPLEYQVKPELKKEVLFRQFNLMNPFPFRKPFHIVFLRNVMIYFDEKTKVELLNKIYDHMAPGGYLFIGTTESMNRNATKFQYVEPSIYKK